MPTSRKIPYVAMAGSEEINENCFIAEKHEQRRREKHFRGRNDT